jgi:hypothetical protein
MATYGHDTITRANNLSFLFLALALAVRLS